jgi:chromatin segregation and condensation protein Rec8/ScpA/Scc1 (kleisin family)
MNISFRDFSRSHNASSHGEARVHIIVSFLAMLELVREGIIDVMQDVSFEDIQITKPQNEIMAEVSQVEIN